METQLNYLNHSTGLTTPANEFDAQTAINAIDLLIDSHYEGKCLKQSTVSRQSKITDFFPQMKKLKSYVISRTQVHTVKSYEHEKITFYFRILSKNNQWRGLDYSIFEIVFKYLSMEECQFVFARVCKQWKHLYFKMFCSYSSLKMIDNANLQAKELKIILDQGSNLAHIRMLKEIIKRDFKNQIKFFNQNIVMQAKVAERLFDNNQTGAITSKKGNQRLLQCFKIKTKAINSQYNFISDGSLVRLCQKSRSSLEEICVRNGTYLSNQAISKSVCILKSLVKLDLSYCRQIDDSVLTDIADNLPQLQNIGLRFLNLITKEPLIKILENLKQLEGLDISGCFSIDLSFMTKLRGNKTLKCLLLEYLMVRCDHLQNLVDSNVTTLSIFYSKTVSILHLETLQEVKSLSNINIQDCPQLQEQDIKKLIEQKEGQRFKVVRASPGLIAPETINSLLLQVQANNTNI